MTQDRKETKPKIRFDKKIDEKIRERKEPPPTKVVIRRLPPSLTSEAFLEQVSPLPDHDYLFFVKADMSLGKEAFTRAYVNFLRHEDIYTFKDKFDSYVFVDARGGEYPAIVELAPFQKVVKKKGKKSDSKKGTLESDPDYEKFLEALANPDSDQTNSLDTYLEELESKEKQLKANHGCLKKTTPLIDFIKQRKEEKRAALQKGREERRKKELERKKIKDDERRRRKEREDKMREKDKLREREKDRDKDYDKKKDDSMVKQLLKNPDREKDKTVVKDSPKDRDSSRSKFGGDTDKRREQLRFSKENRERAAKEKEEEKAKFGRNTKTASSTEKRKSDSEEKNKSFKDDRKNKDEKVKNVEPDRQKDNDNSKEKVKSGDREKDKSRVEGEKDKIKDRETGSKYREKETDYDRKRERDQKRGIEKDKTEIRGKEKIREPSKSISKDKDREDTSRLSPSKSSTEGSGGRDEKKRANSEEDSSRKRSDRERQKADSKTLDTQNEHLGKDISDKTDGHNLSKSRIESLASQSDSSLHEDISKSNHGNGKDGIASGARDDDSAGGRRRRKDRPERAIYVPRKARESRGPVEPKSSEVKSGSGDQQAKT